MKDNTGYYINYLLGPISNHNSENKYVDTWVQLYLDEKQLST